MAGPDTGPADSPDIPPTVCGACCPGDLVCLSPTEVGRCRADGSGHDATPCAEGDACENGACATPPVCEPGARDCLDDTTTLLCRQTGEGWVSATCDEGLVCAQGICTDKLRLGSGCAADDECASGRCRCGDATADGCPSFVTGGICVLPGCDPTSCGSHARCFAASAAPLGAADVDHCVRSCDELDPCPGGSRCSSVPVRGAEGVELAGGCYFDGIAGFGDACTSDEQCLLGGCLADYWSFPFCSRRCDEDGLCPQGSACVKLRPNEYWCSPLCGDGASSGSQDCPLNEPDARFDVICKNFEPLGGGVLRVCAHP